MFPISFLYDILHKLFVIVDLLKLSIVVPAYNEEKSIIQMLDKLLSVKFSKDITKEIIVLNDGSKDNTLALITEYSRTQPEVKVVDNPKNIGKSQTVKRGILMTDGDYVIIQDADLEYDSNDILKLLNKALSENLDFIYGNRFSGTNRIIYKSFYIGNKGISFVSNIFTFLRLKKTIPDMEVCYKLVKGEIFRNIAKTLESRTNFGFEPEVTAKLAKYKINGEHLKFNVLPISYFPRTIEQGKKIRFSDGIKALIEIIKYNLPR